MIFHETKKNVMAVGAHPDDIEFGCSGTLMRHVQAGDDVTIVVMTNSQSVDGVTGKVIRTDAQLYEETGNAADIIGAELVVLSYTDLYIPFSLDSVSEIERYIKRDQIDTLYTHWAGDSNQDHIATYKASIAAALTPISPVSIQLALP